MMDETAPHLALLKTAAEKVAQLLPSLYAERAMLDRRIAALRVLLKAWEALPPEEKEPETL